jgi:hypothetical protein
VSASGRPFVVFVCLFVCFSGFFFIYLCGGRVESNAQDGTDAEPSSDRQGDQHDSSHPNTALRVDRIVPPHQRDARVDQLQLQAKKYDISKI